MGFGYKVCFTERAKNRVLSWDPDRGSITVLAGDGATGDGDQRLHDPYGLAVDGAGHLLIADKLKHRVVRLTNRVDPLRMADVDGHRRNRPDTPPHQRDRIPFCPTGMAVEPDGSLIVGFSDDHTIYRVDPTGKMTLLVGIPPNRPQWMSGYVEQASASQLPDFMIYGPTGLVRTREGTLYFIERGFQSVREFRPGVGLRSIFPVRHSITFRNTPHVPDRGQIADYHPTFPSGLALDQQGRLYVADVSQRAVVRVDLAGGTFEVVYRNPQPPQVGPSGGPSAVGFGPDQTPWVLDSLAGTIQAFKVTIKGPWTPLPTRLQGGAAGGGLTINPAGAGLAFLR